ncbi:MAG: pyridoxamine 5'-phosphate oxidase family protein [Gaiellaceae bacterium]
MLAPTARRPGFHPGYGISKTDEGLLEWSWAEERLLASRNYWIGTTGRGGRPHAIPVWGLWFEGGVVFGTNRSSLKAKNLARDPRVVVHLESGDEVVILEGVVEEIAEPSRLREIEDAYSAKYEFESDLSGEGSVTYELRPQVALAWMESDYPRTATRFEFESA